MALARFGRDSDVYVYEDSRGGYTCQACELLQRGEFRCATAAEMIPHLLAHRARGDGVPESALTELQDASRQKPGRPVGRR
jgi:hypothetical protein